MPDRIINFPQSFLKKPLKRDIAIVPVSPESLKAHKAALSETENSALQDYGFTGERDQICPVWDQGRLICVFLGLGNAISISSGAKINNFFQNHLSQETLENSSFSIQNEDLTLEYLSRLALGWGLAGIKCENNKHRKVLPRLVTPQDIDLRELIGLCEGIYITRSLINRPANHLGPEELSNIASYLAEESGGKANVIQGKKLEKQNFPMIRAVGESSHRPPCLIDLRWSKKNAPKITLVGKGVVFDTGGLDLKPPSAMRLMKKDMGGAAQVLGLAWALMRCDLNIDLRVIIPAAENAVSSQAFRPGDVIKTRKGLDVEIADTDAEGRLVLADALSYACEDSPELLIDFATLTGAARVALGTRIGALFGRQKSLVSKLQDLSLELEDPLWNLPLYNGYKEEMNSQVADMENIGRGKAGAIHGGLFLENFVDKHIKWAHLDVYAWEDNGRDGFDKGGMDQGLRTVFTYIKDNYS